MKDSHKQTTYDKVPYESHPDRLATLERQLVTGKLCLLLRFSALSQPWVRITKR